MLYLLYETNKLFISLTPEKKGFRYKNYARIRHGCRSGVFCWAKECNIQEADPWDHEDLCSRELDGGLKSIYEFHPVNWSYYVLQHL